MCDDTISIVNDVVKQVSHIGTMESRTGKQFVKQVRDTVVVKINHKETMHPLSGVDTHSILMVYEQETCTRRTRRITNITRQQCIAPFRSVLPSAR